ncbi:TetR/AcrR family transcriptional regulator [Acidomonas methanolica]|uniref:Transcriptional regulator TetR n=1 Tax=Acidomonas methanolica NBRC 104435 TaxID=1231351 RepID=A0A023D203_ACIMT|nr:TetR/AcrR family transcriptional regulator [Acidomonas methanolica]MBU2654945.1 TetR/AcrR family transcriptional regulator [Acidomonas methanolica]GAJ27790.1 transcriptional regulator TetR [Acidomonas methanolica NBRC 104435]GBQ50039.1 TetR family transcriptional regulator [Acidomonas methanolica]GEK99173.1 TetR family transcriptional regulator [Acidomonas methanolica NBRC 104435]
MTRRSPPPDIRRAMLDAAHALLDEGGMSALGLRAITRRAGVSATSGDPYFGNHAGVLAALAAEGYDALAEALDRAGADARARGLAYLRFALARPAMFELMFRNDRLDRSNPALRAATERAFAALGMLAAEGSEHERALRATAAWGAVHGLATLAVDGRLERLREMADAPDLLTLVSEALGMWRLG